MLHPDLLHPWRSFPPAYTSCVTILLCVPAAAGAFTGSGAAALAFAPASPAAEVYQASRAAAGASLAADDARRAVAALADLLDDRRSQALPPLLASALPESLVRRMRPHVPADPPAIWVGLVQRQTGGR
jgi:hypothetical protein